jgi:lysyl-tRNA synthetase class 2
MTIEYEEFFMTTETTTQPPTLDENEQMHVRRQKLDELRKQGNAYPNDFSPTNTATELFAQYSNKSPEDLTATAIPVKIAGRMMTRRLMGKASFVHIQDRSGQFQLYVRGDLVGEKIYEDFKHWDIGDIIGAEGTLFKTKTGELSLHVEKIRLLTKALRPLPDKWHGLTDPEKRYRQRYLDLICETNSRDIFIKRSRTISAIRQFLTAEDFMEVETPMMQVLAGGATAKPFVTHHNALDMTMYLRVAPELYLKRLVVGGFERVFEINRNFRNEGVSTRHNPEFTMLEFYQAYADYEQAMTLTESLLRDVVQKTCDSTTIEYQGHTLDFAAPFTRLSLTEALLTYHSDLTPSLIADKKALTAYAEKVGITVANDWGLGKIQLEIFEKTIESKLMKPTFLTGYPTEVSPLARCNDNDPTITDRFELFIGGREVANGFSELNDPEDQAGRFQQQMLAKLAGDEETMPYDEDYIMALEYGLPPTAGVGIGIDRLVMLLTDSPSIREVILFPHMRKE